jgi:hypothetical protein
MKRGIQSYKLTHALCPDLYVYLCFFLVLHQEPEHTWISALGYTIKKCYTGRHLWLYQWRIAKDNIHICIEQSYQKHNACVILPLASIRQRIIAEPGLLATLPESIQVYFYREFQHLGTDFNFFD